VDDEADSASLNTKVNKNEQSTINKYLDAIKKSTSSSIFLEVTGTPQSILLQTAKSGWKPYFVYYFRPGEGYIGGDFFFPPELPNHIILTDNNEAEELLNDDEFPENGLKKALIMHLVSSGHIILSGGNVCNFLIHPSAKTNQHAAFAEKIGNYLNEIAHSHEEDETREAFRLEHYYLSKTKTDIKRFEDIYEYIIDQLNKDNIKINIFNSVVAYESDSQYDQGINIIVGGNSLGRGVTIPQLQTIYYCRVSKNPQADTMWQHARMFGYDRDSALMRVFMPPKLFKLFSDINRTNNSIIKQIEKNSVDHDIKIFYPTGLQPARKTVLDKKAVGIYSGGVNYFPFYPINTDISYIDKILEFFQDGVYTVSLQVIKKLLEQMDSEVDDWNSRVFVGFVNSIVANNPIAQGKLVVRRNRDIGIGTGTLLSPTDRVLGENYKEEVVLTLYKITGNKNKGWDERKIWIPNIKLPGDYVYYSGETA